VHRSAEGLGSGPSTGELLRAEDLPVGALLHLGGFRVTREAVTSFAAQWDPLPIHLDRDVAATTAFGDVIGSGVHTLAIFQRLAVAGAYRHWAVLAGAAVTMQFLRPLRPDTDVDATLRIDVVELDSPTRALVRSTGAVLQQDVVLLELAIRTWVWRR
jgi:acyl dehydratase